MSESADNFRRGGSFSVSLFLGTDKVKIRVGGGNAKIFRRNFFVSQCRKRLQGNSFALCFRKSPEAKKTMDKQMGISRHSIEHFLSHSAEIFRRGDPLVFHYFRVSRKFG